jgi:hypothetical protein
MHRSHHLLEKIETDIRQALPHVVVWHMSPAAAAIILSLSVYLL